MVEATRLFENMISPPNPDYCDEREPKAPMKLLTQLASLFDRRLHWIYAVLGATFVLGAAVVVPPLRVPDEQGHLFASRPLARGGLIEGVIDGGRRRN